MKQTLCTLNIFFSLILVLCVLVWRSQSLRFLLSSHYNSREYSLFWGSHRIIKNPNSNVSFPSGNHLIDYVSIISNSHFSSKTNTTYRDGFRLLLDIRCCTTPWSTNTHTPCNISSAAFHWRTLSRSILWVLSASHPTAFYLQNWSCAELDFKGLWSVGCYE